MFRAGQFSGYPDTFVEKTEVEIEPRNMPTLLERQSAGRQLAAGPSQGLDGLLTSIIEMKDTPATLKGLFSFAKFVWQLRKRPSNLLSKATVREVVGLYLNFTYGVQPTLSECERFRDSLIDELRTARTSIDAMFEAASDSLSKSTRHYRQWLAAREKRDEEIRIQRQLRLEQREAERKSRKLEAHLLKLQRDLQKTLLDVARMSKQQLANELHARRLDAFSQLQAESDIRSALRSQLDDLWDERDAELLKMHEHLQGVVSDSRLKFSILDYYLDLAWINGYSYTELYKAKIDYDLSLLEIGRLKREREDYTAQMSAFKEALLDQLERSYLESQSLQDYLDSLASLEDDIADEDLRILQLQYDHGRTREDIDALYSRPKHHSGDRTTYGSAKLTRTYNLPDTYISARRRLYKEPGGALYTANFDDSGHVSFDVTYRRNGWDIVPNPTDAITSLVKDAIRHLFQAKMITACKQTVIYKQWPLSVLSKYYTPFGNVCDFSHAFLQPLQTMWSLTPWSFVADWFADLSASFGALEAEFTRAVLGLPSVDTWSASSFRSLLATNLDHSIPVSVEQEWLSNPDALATEHTVRYTVRIRTPNSVTFGGSSGDAFVRRPEPSGGVAGFLPPPNLIKVLNHATEGLALLTQQILK
jgi:hypothetical protein